MNFGQFSKGVVIAGGALAIVLLMVVGGTAIWAVSLNNNVVSLEQRIVAQQDVVQLRYDTMKKIIFQQAEISDKYAADFKEVFPQIIAGRYKGEGNPLLKFIKESNPNFDIRLYAKLMTTVEGQRTKFEQEQKQLVDLVREHKSTVSNDRWPHRYVVGGRPTPEVTIITSTDAKTAIVTGVDDEKELFPKKK